MGERQDEPRASGELLVLLVEDDPDLLQLTEACLEQQGLLVVTARDGERALRLLRVLQPDVVVTDLIMPVMDGFALIRNYRAQFGAAPMLAVSSLEAYLPQALDLGAEAVMPKPVDIPELVKSIKALASGSGGAARSFHSSELEELQPWADLEESRLRAIVDLKLDKPAPEAALHDFVDAVARHFDVPIALISIITEGDQFWSAGCGIPTDLSKARGGPRQESFCTHAVSARAALIVQDALENPLFKNNPFVASRGIRFYAGVPLIARHGQLLGTLCLLDHRPRLFTHSDLELLTVFGRCVLSTIEHREHTMAPEIPESVFRYLHYVDHDLDCLGTTAFRELAVVEGARAAEVNQSMACAVMALPAKRLSEGVQALRRRNVRGLVGRLGHARLGWLVPGIAAEQATEMAQAAVGPHSFVVSAQLTRYAGAVRTALAALEDSLGDAGLI